MTTLQSPSARPRMLMLEFNELSPRLLERFMGEGALPNFSRLHRRSRTYVTDAGEAPPRLEPWIQWVTVHSGQPCSDHQVQHLGDGHRLATAQVWDLLSASGLKVWVCGSMNVRYDRPLNGAVLPDPWSTGATPHPDGYFDHYCTFVRRNVQEYTSNRVPLSAADYLRFLAFMAGHGLSLATVAAIARQLAGERLTGRGKWRRVALLDRLQFDLFRWYYRHQQPDFSTFFLNSTAHLQHMYWRNMEPDVFRLKPAAGEQREYRDAVRFGYRMMDRMVGQALDMAGAGGTVVLATALSQQPCLRYEETGGKTFYRPKAFDRLLAHVRIADCREVVPVMSEQFHLRFDSATQAHAAAEALRALRVDGQPAMLVQEEGDSLLAGCRIHHQLPPTAMLESPGLPATPFFQLLYQAEGLKSGMHHPDGVFWISQPGVAPDPGGARVPLCDVAPTLLQVFGIAAPPHMTGRALAPGRAAPAAPAPERIPEPVLH